MTTRSFAIFSLATAIALAPLFMRAACWNERESRAAEEIKLPSSSARALLIGSGFDVRSTEKQIEQDIALAQELLGGRASGGALAEKRAITLFARGPAEIGVRSLEPVDTFDERMFLGWLFGGDLLAGHRLLPPEIEVDHAATSEAIEAVFAADTANPQLEIIFFAGHGERRERITQSFITLSMGERLSVAELSAMLDEYPGREGLARLFVNSACYSGAFGEIIFKGGDAALGFSDELRCGLFASSADDPATGCSPDGDREEQEGFALYFFNALRGLGRDGRQHLNADLDGDGLVSALEAHAIARAHADTIDLPTTSSERALRYLAELSAEHGRDDEPQDALDKEADEADDPIERYTIEALKRSLGVHSEEEAAAELERASRAIEALDAVFREAEDELSQEMSRLEAKILAISPNLSDAFGAGFESAFRAHRGKLRSLLDSEESDGVYAALELIELLTSEQEPALIRHAKLRRLLRAYENLRLLAQLGTKELEYYRAIRRCEARSLFSQKSAP